MIINQTMPTLNSNAIFQVAEALYDVNRQTYISDVSQYIEQRIQSGMAQIKNGEYMEFDEFDQKAMAIPLQ